MQTFLDSIHLVREKMLDLQYVEMNNEDHLSAVSKLNASHEMTARPDYLSSVHNSLADIKEDANFAEAVNG